MAKIARQNFKVFGLTGDTADFAKFGSQEAAAPIKTKDIELIQSLEAWDKGWADAIVDANKAPYMEDMNAAMYVIAYELGYILQEGIPEWDDGTTYYAESIVKKTTTQELYASKTNDNTNNALPNKVDNTDWKYLVDLDDIVPVLSITEAKIAEDAINGDMIIDGFIITPASAVVGFTIDQHQNAVGMVLDSEASQDAFDIFCKFGLHIRQDITGGRGLVIERVDGLEQVESEPLISFIERNAEATQPVLEIGNAGTGNDITAPNFSLKNGYIAPGGNEALRWDVVEMDLDGTSPDSVAYTLDGTKAMGIMTTSYDVNSDIVYGGGTPGWTFFDRKVKHDGTNLQCDYETGYVSGDDVRVIIFTKA